MTWLSYSTKALILLGILPLVLKKFSPSEYVIWNLFATIISLQTLADFGFRQTFTRIISFAFGGATSIDVITIENSNSVTSNAECNEVLLSSIMVCMRFIYKWLSLIALFIISIVGTLSLKSPISKAPDQLNIWIAWSLIAVTTFFSFYAKMYMNFLEGLNQIALVRRVETFTSLGSIISSIFVLVWFPTLLNLVIVNQFWVLVVSFRDYYLAKNVNSSLYLRISKNSKNLDKSLLKKIWGTAWKSGVGGLMSAGVTNSISLIYAQIGNTSDVAAYLLAIRIITQIRDISMAPFYSKLPLLVIFRVKNDLPSLISLVKKGMRLSHIVFFLGFIFVTVFIQPLLKIVHSEVGFVSMNLWFLLAFAFFTVRFGAMHLQVYLSTNHIISHIVESVSGLLFITTSYLLANVLNIYAIPVGMIVGYGLFYCWYSAFHSYKSIGSSCWTFEKSVSFPVLLAFFLFFLFYFKIN